MARNIFEAKLYFNFVHIKYILLDPNLKEFEQCGSFYLAELLKNYLEENLEHFGQK